MNGRTAKLSGLVAVLIVIYVCPLSYLATVSDLNNDPSEDAQDEHGEEDVQLHEGAQRSRIGVRNDETSRLPEAVV